MPAVPSRPRVLDGLERWFQTEVLRPHRRKARPGAQAALHLLPSRSLSAAERIGIYSGGYMLRLQECMQADFPAVRAIAGEQRFTELVRAYLERHPSRHWSLNPLGHSFAHSCARTSFSPSAHDSQL